MLNQIFKILKEKMSSKKKITLIWLECKKKKSKSIYKFLRCYLSRRKLRLSNLNLNGMMKKKNSRSPIFILKKKSLNFLKYKDKILLNKKKKTESLDFNKASLKDSEMEIFMKNTIELMKWDKQIWNSWSDKQIKHYTNQTEIKEALFRMAQKILFILEMQDPHTNTTPWEDHEPINKPKKIIRRYPKFSLTLWSMRLESWIKIIFKIKRILKHIKMEINLNIQRLTLNL